MDEENKKKWKEVLVVLLFCSPYTIGGITFMLLGASALSNSYTIGLLVMIFGAIWYGFTFPLCLLWSRGLISKKLNKTNELLEQIVSQKDSFTKHKGESQREEEPKDFAFSEEKEEMGENEECLEKSQRLSLSKNYLN